MSNPLRRSSDLMPIHNCSMSYLILFFAGSVVVFDGIISNIGGHFNPDTSSFQCPYDGSYMFSVNFASYRDTFMYVEIYQNDKPHIIALADDLPEAINFASSFVIIPCQAGDKVWIRSPFGGFMYSTNIDTYSHFSGCMLQRYL